MFCTWTIRKKRKPSYPTLRTIIITTTENSVIYHPRLLAFSLSLSLSLYNLQTFSKNQLPLVPWTTYNLFGTSLSLSHSRAASATTAAGAQFRRNADFSLALRILSFSRASSMRVSHIMRERAAPFLLFLGCALLRLYKDISLSTETFT